MLLLTVNTGGASLAFQPAPPRPRSGRESAPTHSRWPSLPSRQPEMPASLSLSSHAPMTSSEERRKMSFATERRGYYRRRDTLDSPVARSLQFLRACGVSNTLECEVVHHNKIASRCPRGVIFDRDVECALDSGQFQAAVLTGCWAWRSSYCAGLISIIVALFAGVLLGHRLKVLILIP